MLASFVGEAAFGKSKELPPQRPESAGSGWPSPKGANILGIERILTCGDNP
jgi:hypothetical protein